MNSDLIYLRQLSIDDCDVIAQLANNKKITDNTLMLPFPYAVEDAHTWLKLQSEQFENNKAYNYAIVRREDNVLVGVIGISNEKYDRGELGYWVGEPYWGNSYATAASLLLVEYAFNELNFNRVYSYHFFSNAASGRVMQKIGMKYEGVQKEHVFKNGEYVDIVMYGVVKSDYIKNNV